MKSMTRNAVITLALLMPATAFASSSAEWEKFAKDVEQKCDQATKDMFRKSQIVVDPTGTESYGVAIVFGRSKEEKGPAAAICVMDKKTGKVEVGTTLGKDVVRIRKPKEGQDDKAGKKDNAKQDSNAGNADEEDDAQ